MLPHLTPPYVQDENTTSVVYPAHSFKIQPELYRSSTFVIIHSILFWKLISCSVPFLCLPCFPISSVHSSTHFSLQVKVQSRVQLPESSIMMVSTYHVAIRIKTLGPALMHWTSLTETNEDRSNANNKNNTINDCGAIVLIYTIEDCSNTGRRFM